MTYKKYFLIFFIEIIFLFIINSMSHAEPVQEFDTGVHLYQNKSFKEAKEVFQKLQSQNPDSPEIIHNLGLSSYALGENSLALAYFRTLLVNQPRNFDAYASIRLIQSKFENKDFIKETSFFDELNEKVLNWFKLPEWLILQILFLLFTGIILAPFFGLRKKSRKKQEAVPPFRLRHYAIIAAFIVIHFLTLLKIADAQMTKATLIYNGKISVKSGPSTQASDLYELYDGFEVIIDSQYKEWSQISYQDNITGWVETKNLITHQKPFFNLM